MGLKCVGVDFKIRRNGVIVGKGSAGMVPGNRKQALIKAIEQYIDSEQFERDTDSLGGDFTIQVEYLVDTVMP